MPFAPEEHRVRPQRLPTSLQRAVVCAPRHRSGYGAHPPPCTPSGLSPARVTQPCIRRLRRRLAHPSLPSQLPERIAKAGIARHQSGSLGKDNRRDCQVGIQGPQRPNSRPWVRDWHLMVAGGWQVQPAPRGACRYPMSSVVGCRAAPWAGSPHLSPVHNPRPACAEPRPIPLTAPRPATWVRCCACSASCGPISGGWCWRP